VLLTAHARSTIGRATPQGEALATWALWALVLLAILVTYSRLEPAELYHVSNDGIAGGLSRVLIELNFPISLVAIALGLVALAALPRRAWWLGGPAIALCAVTAWPGVVDQDDLDARWVNALPATGVALVFALTLAATRRAGPGFARSLPLDRVRVVIAVVAALVSIPWIAAILGVYFPEGIFIMERPGLEPDGTTIAAVHLGQHHGFVGTLIVGSALLLSRPRMGTGRLATATYLYVALAFAYGAVNLVQDYWNEQLVKRGWLDWKIPSALHPKLAPVWLVVLGLTALVALALRREAATVDSTA
jgi:hypothetical protein